MSSVETAMELRSRGRLLEALDVLTARGESETHTLELRGEIEFELGRFQEAALSYFGVVSSEPSRADAHYNLALCLQRSQRWRAASQAFERAMALDPGHHQARLGLGACLLNLGCCEQALKIFDVAREPMEDASLAFGRGVALQLLGRSEQARSMLEKALISDSVREEALSNLVAIAVTTGDMQLVRDYCSRLQKASPRSSIAVQGLALAAFEKLDNAAAARYCDRILQLDPECLEAWHNLRIATDRMLSAFCDPQPALSSTLREAR